MVYSSCISSVLYYFGPAIWIQEGVVYLALHWAHKNVVSRYAHHGYSVYGCFLDASKAFDHVNHHTLFTKLSKRNLPPVLN